MESRVRNRTEERLDSPLEIRKDEASPLLVWSGRCPAVSVAGYVMGHSLWPTLSKSGVSLF